MAREEKKAKVEFDFGLGGLFKGIGSLFDLASEKTAQSGGGN